MCSQPRAQNTHQPSSHMERFRMVTASVQSKAMEGHSRRSQGSLLALYDHSWPTQTCGNFWNRLAAHLCWLQSRTMKLIYNKVMFLVICKRRSFPTNWNMHQNPKAAKALRLREKNESWSDMINGAALAQQPSMHHASLSISLRSDHWWAEINFPRAPWLQLLSKVSPFMGNVEKS